MTDISDRAWWFAISDVLSDWNDSMSVSEVLDAVELLTDDVVVWQPFELMSGDKVLTLIINLATKAQELINEVKQEITNATSTTTN